jgi:hypothetical protein
LGLRVAFWGSFAGFCYNYYLVSYKDNPESEPGAVPFLMGPAKAVAKKIQNATDV